MYFTEVVNSLRELKNVLQAYITNMTSLRSILAFNMKVQRQILGISQAKLAEKAATSTNYIAQIEQKNRFPTPEMLERIASALEIDSPQLFSAENNYDEVIRQFQESFLADIGTVVSEAAYAKLAELKIRP